jgi:ParB family chromosome partitioning protein
MTTEEAIIAMVDSNLQREQLLPSEKAFAYKMKMDARKSQGKRTDLTSTPVVSKLRTDEKVGLENGESREQIRRYIRLTYLIYDLLQMVDEGRIALRPAVELSYLTVREQSDLLETIRSEDATPSLAQAIQMKKLSQSGGLTMDNIFCIMTEQKPNQVEKIKLSMDKFEKYFPRGTPPARIEVIILRALSEYYARRKRNG